MKKILSILAALALTAGVSWGQAFAAYNVLNVKALQTGTNGWGVTNLANLVTNLGMIFNPTNLSYTNLSGVYQGSSTSYLATAGTTNSTSTATLFKDIPLFTDELGRPINFNTWAVSAAGLQTNFTWFSPQTLFIEYVNPFGSNAAFGVTFRPVWDDGTSSTSTADDWGFNIAYALTTKGTLATNIPTYKWPGAKALRVVSVTNQFALAGANAQTNSTFITKMSAGGFRP